MYDELQAKFLDWLRLTYSMSCDSFACAYSQPNRRRGIKSARHKQARSCSKPIAQRDPHRHISHTSYYFHPRPPGGDHHRAINAYNASTYATNLYPTTYVAGVHNTTYVNGPHAVNAEASVTGVDITCGVGTGGDSERVGACGDRDRVTTCNNGGGTDTSDVVTCATDIPRARPHSQPWTCRVRQFWRGLANESATSAHCYRRHQVPKIHHTRYPLSSQRYQSYTRLGFPREALPRLRSGLTLKECKCISIFLLLIRIKADKFANR